MGAGTRRLSVPGNDDAGDGGDTGEPGQTRQGLVIENIDVITVSGDEAREGRGSTTPGRHGGQGQASHDGDEDDQDQPRSPPTAQLTTEYQQDRAQDHLPCPVLLVDRRPPRRAVRQTSTWQHQRPQQTTPRAGSLRSDQAGEPRISECSSARGARRYVCALARRRIT